MVKSPLWKKAGFSVDLSCHPKRESCLTELSSQSFKGCFFLFVAFLRSCSVSAEAAMEAVGFIGQGRMCGREALMGVILIRECSLFFSFFVCMYFY